MGYVREFERNIEEENIGAFQFDHEVAGFHRKDTKATKYERANGKIILNQK